MSPISGTVRTLIHFYRAGVLWWAAVIAVGFLLIGTGIEVWGTPDRSIWAYADEPIRWVVLVMGLLVAPSLFRVMVAHGVTRRSFAIGSGLAIGLFALAVALYAVAGFLVERALYAAAGTPANVVESHLFDSTGQVHLVFAEYGLISAAYLVTGWLIGVAFQRYWLLGVVLLPVAMLPAVLVDSLLGTRPDGWFPEQADLGTPDLPLGVALLLAVGVVVLGLLGGHGYLHRVPLRQGRS
jgi:hypothetical protein